MLLDLWHLQLCSRFFRSFQPVPFVLISCSLQLGPLVFIFSGIELNRNLGLVSGTKEVWESGFVPFLSSHLTSQLSTCFFSPRAVLSVCRFKPWSSSDLHLLGVHSRLYWKNTLPPVMWEHCHAEYLLFSLEKCFYHLARLSSAIVPLFLKITVMLGMNLAPFALAVTGAVRPENYFFLMNTSSFLAFCLGLATQVYSSITSSARWSGGLNALGQAPMQSAFSLRWKGTDHNSLRAVLHGLVSRHQGPWCFS